MINSSRDTKILKILGVVVLLIIVLLLFGKRNGSILPVNIFSPIKNNYSVDNYVPIKRNFSGLYYGVNVDMSLILPSSKNYILNAQGEDLIDIANHLGINLFRITNSTTLFGSNKGESLYTKEQWNTVLNKMQKNGIKAIIVIETNSSNSDIYSDTINQAYIKLVNDYIIKSSVGDNPDVFAIDLKNEPILSDNNVGMIQKAAAIVKKRYPHMLLTVGDGKTLTSYDNNGNPVYFYNDFKNISSKLKNIVDFYSIHAYGYDKQISGVYPNPYLLTNNFISQMRQFDKNKPILIEEFGSGNGDAVTDQETLGSKELQANVYAGVYQYVNDMKTEKVIGAVSYQFMSRDHNVDGWAIMKDNGSFFYPAAYTLQKYATGKSDIPLQFPLTSLPTDYMLTNTNWGQVFTVKKGDIIGLDLSLDNTVSNSLTIDNTSVLYQQESLLYDESHKKYFAVLHAIQPGTSTITITQNNKCDQSNPCAVKQVEKFKATIVVTGN